MAAPEHATCPANVSMTSTRGPPIADVILAFDDVSIDSVNVDQVNGSTGSMYRVSGSAVSWAHQSVSQETLTGESRVSAGWLTNSAQRAGSGCGSVERHADWADGAQVAHCHFSSSSFLRGRFLGRRGTGDPFLLFSSSLL